MYAYIDGKLTFKNPAYVVVEAGGIGYHINISLNTYSALGDAERCKLYTWLHVKEDAHTLYGFADEGERRLFLHLISVSGIGPNTGRMILSSITPVEIQTAIVKADLPLIQRIKGLGAKTAQRLVLELQDKLKKEGADSLISMPQHNTVKDEALSALVMLGFAKQTAEKTIDQILKGTEGTLSVEQLIKQALKNL
ncbi:MAG: Holliday junction branch migration protein RuvA [Pedobacter agri]|uniref:Holliday junction branch migration complex subunit RuvA n=1 Tax=Pedobacter agri TaxID=454586 RepID=A0A9X3I9N1_9SPHI|nr:MULTISPECIES: Holliday junction branch migration protein RuvA [Pedobacter]AZI24596.1 Holliday junction branch migration protein RuvA [Pedobacter sp. G11]MCX3264718.1 Holliday junction branch migration protein RuvA [Pedobacter agri]MDQ1140499.1 Holliday junction DNA helicase RuvA [Pedobacter agri]RYD78931.1 MAG: Holliday junction branch migration protein RuvA [Sphingobacteriales bacterium]